MLDEYKLINFYQVLNSMWKSQLLNILIERRLRNHGLTTGGIPFCSSFNGFTTLKFAVLKDNWVFTEVCRFKGQMGFH